MQLDIACESDYICLQQEAETNPIAVASIIGRVLAGIPTHLTYFNKTFAEQLLTENEICQRIDFVLPYTAGGQACFSPKDKMILTDEMIWDSPDDETLIISDKNGMFRYLTLDISRNDNVYAIDATEGIPPTDRDLVWSFYLENDHVCVHEPLMTFEDLILTRAMVLMIKWFTNVLNYEDFKMRL